MNYKEVKADLFDYHDKGYWLAHCISADFKLGAGIAKEFDKRFGLREELLSNFGSDWYLEFESDEGGKRGNAILHPQHNVIDLVTKVRYWQKPTLFSLWSALVAMRMGCDANNITKVAMPKIGCGLDKLLWGDVRVVIQAALKDTDMDIVVCYL